MRPREKESVRSGGLGNTKIVFARLVVAIVATALSLLPMRAAIAHGLNSNGAPSGLSIPSLAHGQLQVMAEYRNAVVELAERQINPDTETKKLLNFVNLQYAYCLWGLIPGSLTDESNPFNACAHAYLAATKALLAHLVTAADRRVEAERLAEAINFAMLLRHSSLEICRNSFDALNASEIVYPRISDTSVNMLAVILFLILISATTICAFSWGQGRKDSSGKNP
jgi:hypothetical protein